MEVNLARTKRLCGGSAKGESVSDVPVRFWLGDTSWSHNLKSSVRCDALGPVDIARVLQCHASTVLAANALHCTPLHSTACTCTFISTLFVRSLSLARCCLLCACDCVFISRTFAARAKASSIPRHFTSLHSHSLMFAFVCAHANSSTSLHFAFLFINAYPSAYIKQAPQTQFNINSSWSQLEDFITMIRLFPTSIY